MITNRVASVLKSIRSNLAQYGARRYVFGVPPRIAVCFGTRPEAIKLGPVVQELRRRGVEPTIVCTGQHTTLLAGTPATGALVPHVQLGLASDNDPLHYAARATAALRTLWAVDRPDLVVVVGDTASAYAGAQAAWGSIPVVHVEAGIRSGDEQDPWPEETFRYEIDNIASQNNGWKFAPTDRAKCNLLDWWHTETTGNPGIDALYSHTQPTAEVQDRVLITLHRRESFGAPLERIVTGLWRGAEAHRSLEFIWPVHPNPEIRRVLDSFGGLPQPGNLAYWLPMGVLTFAQQLSTSRVVITDSGGVQEEAAALGIPCCVAREKTDRPESVDAGLARIIGRTSQGVLDGLDWALGFSTRPDPSHCFGDGHAAPRIVDHLLTGD